MRTLTLAIVIFVVCGAAPVAYAQPKPAAPAKEPTKAEKEATASASVAVLVVVIIAGFVCYFLPTLIAMMRGHANTAPILVVNLLLGWLLVGWVIALAWSFSSQARPRYRPRY